jgi:rhodanese-related sulfurtransferase
MSEVPELPPQEVDRRWPEGQRDGVVLLDVREQDELELAAIEGARHIPMRQVPERLAELPKDKPIVVFCHLGGRSRRVAQFLAANGFEQVFNLDGGIDAWSQTIDERVGRY